VQEVARPLWFTTHGTVCQQQEEANQHSETLQSLSA